MRIIKYSLVSLIVSLLLFSPLNAQPNARMKERIRTMKKIRLMDFLDLDEERELKFLVKYNSIEDKLENAISDLDDIEEQLMKAIKNEDESKIKTLTSKFIEAKKAILMIDEERMKLGREMLDDIEFAKFVVFEKRFREELTKHILRRKKKASF